MHTEPTNDKENKRDADLDEELSDVLIAISVISKRLARKLTQQTNPESSNMKGVKTDE